MLISKRLQKVNTHNYIENKISFSALNIFINVLIEILSVFLITSVKHDSLNL